jgi:glucose/arabinose dehydrogenase
MRRIEIRRSISIIGTIFRFLSQGFSMRTDNARFPERTRGAAIARRPARACAALVLAVAIVSAAARQPAAARPEAVILATGLASPWAVAFLPDGRFLVSEKRGALRVLRADGAAAGSVQGVPRVDARGQGGLLDVVTDADFARNRTLYVCFTEPSAEGDGANGTAMARATLSADAARLDDLRVIFRQRPKVASTLHHGCRIVESADRRHLFLALGERSSFREQAQRLDNHLGKVVRVGKDGAVPADNPFVGTAGALPEIWSYGHRNAQGATLAPNGALWMHEHGPQGGDEINTPRPGGNYGWPVVTYGEEYGGGRIGEGPARAGMEPPLHHWVPSIAPSGMAFLTSDRYGPRWKGDLFVGSLKFRYLDRIRLDADGKVIGEDRLLAGLQERIRDVRQGPDGLLYLLTDGDGGKLLRLDPPAGAGPR